MTITFRLSRDGEAAQGALEELPLTPTHHLWLCFCLLRETAIIRSITAPVCLIVT
jgi:hypothetical protein